MRHEGLSRLLLLLSLFPGLAAGQALPGDAEEGARLAQTWCSNCHLQGTSGGGPANDAAPPFARIARRPGITALSLNVFLQTPHANMPNYQLTNAERDDLVAYILAFAKH